MYEDNFNPTDFSISSSKKGFLEKWRIRKIERNKELVLVQYHRYESIKSKYGWQGKKRPFIMYGEYCQAGKDRLYFEDNFTPKMVEDFVDRCEAKAERHQAKRLKQDERRTLHANLYGDLERMVLALGGKFKYKKNGVYVVLPDPDELGITDDYFLDYNCYDKTFLEEKVLVREKAHQARLDFIARESAATKP